MKKRQTHYKERGQPEERRGLGVLEKKRHFVARSVQERDREEKIQKIKKLSAESNPDEFQFFMHKYRRIGMRLVKKEEEKGVLVVDEGVSGEREAFAQFGDGTASSGKYCKRDALPQRIAFTD